MSLGYGYYSERQAAEARCRFAELMERGAQERAQAAEIARAAGAPVVAEAFREQPVVPAQREEQQELLAATAEA